MKKILFLYDHKDPLNWKDGLSAALELLAKESFHTIKKENLHNNEGVGHAKWENFDFVLGWGAFNSPVDNYLQKHCPIKKGLCLAGNTFPYAGQNYDVIFYETQWTKQWLEQTAKAPLPKLIHAFGTNTNLYHPPYNATQYLGRTIDILSVGAFASWKRQEKLLEKAGIRMVIGEIQQDNLAESMSIIGPLLMGGVAVANMKTPEELRKHYWSSRKLYIPADVYGGGERAILEAQACGVEQVEVEDDNPKLQELIGKSWSEHYYAMQLEKGIKEACAT